MATTIERNLHFNDTRRIIADPAPEGYDFIGWDGDINALNDPTSIETIVTMPEADVTVEAKYAIRQPALRLVWYDISNIYKMVNNIESVADWNNYFGLPANGNSFTEVRVIGDEVRLIGGSNITLSDYLFVNDYSLNLLKVIDEANCVVNISNRCFSDEANNIGCYALDTAIFPAVTNVGNYAFFYCKQLVTTNFDSLIEAGEFAFYNCTLLPVLNAPNATRFYQYCFGNCTSLDTVNALNLERADDYCFTQTLASTHYNFPKLTYAGEGCFYIRYGGECLTINLPKCVFAGDYCFAFLEKIETIYIPLLKEINNGIFMESNWHDLEGINVSAITSIAANGFISSGNFTPEQYANSTLLLNSLVSLGDSAFKNSGFIRVYMPNITALPDNCFYASRIQRISNTDIPNVTTLGNACFMLSSIENVILHNIIAIPDNCFTSCYKLANVDMPDVITIGNISFGGCYELYNVSFLKCTTIGTQVFDSTIGYVGGFAKLVSVNFAELTYIPANTFHSFTLTGGNDITYFNIPKVTGIYWNGGGEGYNEGVWNIVGKNITIIINPILRTNNNGGLDAAIQYLVDNNNVTLINAA